VRTSNKTLILCLIFFFFSAKITISSEDENHLTALFLGKSGVWLGEFTNFVNQKGGAIQQGKMHLKMEVDKDRIINMSTAIIGSDGRLGEYQGYATLKVEGNRLNWVGSTTEDKTTGNTYENYVWDGYIGRNHIYVLNSYEEIYPDGRREKRRYDLHYIFLSQESVIMLADIFVDDRLLVFANTTLKRQI
jgi:hypothetical protein